MLWNIPPGCHESSIVMAHTCLRELTALSGYTHTGLPGGSARCAVAAATYISRHALPALQDVLVVGTYTVEFEANNVSPTKTLVAYREPAS